MRQASLPKRSPPHAPAPCSAGKSDLQCAGRVAFEALREPQFLRTVSQQPFARPPQQPFSGTIHQPQPAMMIERENGDVDLTHDGPEKRRRFERPKTLLAEC